MIDVKPLRSDAEVQVHAGPVADLRVVDACHAGLSPQFRQRTVGGLHLSVVRYADLQLSGTDAHPLRQEVPVLLRVLQPILVLVSHLLLKVRRVRQ